MANKNHRSNCPISSSLDIWGDKWSLLIVRDLLFSKQCTYGDFLKADEKIATNILASRLQMLEENGIIRKLDHPESRAKVLYQLTQKGIDLLPLMVEIHLWADKYSTIPLNQQEVTEQIKANKKRFIENQLKVMARSYTTD